MSTKRRRPSYQADTSKTRAKRTKFTLETTHVPTSVQSGTILVTGSGEVGQLGLGPDIFEKTRPVPVSLKHEIIDICAGGMHTVCLTKDGEVLTFGCNDEGALGRDTASVEDAEFTPSTVELPGKAKQISAGDSHTAALLEDGQVFAWGTFRDSHGNLGMTKDGNERLPYAIMPGEVVVKIASGADHIVFLTVHGEVYTCGCAEQGQLGRTSNRGSDRNARNGSGQLTKLLIPSRITPKMSLKLHFEDIWAGIYCTFAKVAEQGGVFVFGLNNYYQLGLKSIEPQYIPKKSPDFSKYSWKEISSGQHHTIGLTVDGKVYAIGRKDYGRLGLGQNCEDAEQLTPVPFFNDKKVITVSCGSTTSFAVTENGDLYGWGMGNGGQLGTGSEDDCFEPTLIRSKGLTDKIVLRVKGGGQHAVVLAMETSSSNDRGDGNIKDVSNGTKTSI